MHHIKYKRKKKKPVIVKFIRIPNLNLNSENYKHSTFTMYFAIAYATRKDRCALSTLDIVNKCVFFFFKYYDKLFPNCT